MTNHRLIRVAFLLFLASVSASCSGTVKSIKEKLNPKASVMGVSVVEFTPTHMTLKVDVKTDDVDLMLGMVKMKYKFTVLDTAKEHGSDSVLANELLGLTDSGFAFLVKIPFDKAAGESKLGYLVQGSIVFKVIAKIADVPFSYKGEVALNP